MMDECYLNAERSSQVRSAIDRDAVCYRLLCQEKKASVQLFLHQFFKKVDEMLSASAFFAALKSAAVGGLPILGRNFKCLIFSWIQFTLLAIEMTVTHESAVLCDHCVLMAVDI
jgi:hypothetical protein